jgi:hypothetical protein
MSALNEPLLLDFDAAAGGDATRSARRRHIVGDPQLDGKEDRGAILSHGE